MLPQLSEAHRVEHAALRHAAFAGKRNPPAHQGEFADGVGVRVDTEQASELEGAPVPPPIQFHAVGVAVDLDRHAVFAASGQYRLNVDLVARPSQQQPACDVTENGGVGVGHRSYDAGGLFGLVHAEAAVHARHHDIEGVEDVVGVIQ